jgi:hypothetical protein
MADQQNSLADLGARTSETPEAPAVDTSETPAAEAG